MGNAFGIGEVFGEGWATFKKHGGALSLGVLIAGVLLFLYSFTLGLVPLLGLIGRWYLEAFFFCGIWRMALAAIDGKEARLEQLFAGVPHWGIAGLAFGALAFTIVGFSFLLLLPGLLVAALFGLWMPLVVDRAERPFVALGQSYHLVKPQLWTWAGLFVVLGLLGILGALCLFVGIVPAVALGALVAAAAYRKTVPAHLLSS